MRLGDLGSSTCRSPILRRRLRRSPHDSPISSLATNPCPSVRIPLRLISFFRSMHRRRVREPRKSAPTSRTRGGAPVPAGLAPTPATSCGSTGPPRQTRCSRIRSRFTTLATRTTVNSTSRSPSPVATIPVRFAAYSQVWVRGPCRRRSRRHVQGLHPGRRDGTRRGPGTGQPCPPGDWHQWPAVS